MKTTLTSLLLAAVIGGVPVAFGAPPASVPRATATVELVNPEDFTDFRTTFMGSVSEAQSLAKELQRETNRLAGNILPAGYKVLLRITDVDMAGGFEPHRRSPLDQIRVMRGVYTPRIELAYSVTDAVGNVVASGERRLVEPGYDLRVYPMGRDRLTVETEMLADFFREIARKST